MRPVTASLQELCRLHSTTLVLFWLSIRSGEEWIHKHWINKINFLKQKMKL